MFKVELSEQEINFVVSVLDKIQLSGLQNQNMCLGIANKLSQLLQAVANPAELPELEVPETEGEDPTAEKIIINKIGTVGIGGPNPSKKLNVKK